MKTTTTPEPSQPAPSDAAVGFARLLIEKWPCIAYDISVPCSVPDSKMREFQARHIAPFLQGALARVTVDAGVPVAHHSAQLQQLGGRVRELEGALLPLMLLKSQHCDGQIGWRSQLTAIAGEIRVKDIIRAEKALDGTTLVEDAKTYVEHKWQEDNGRGVLNRPQGPCSCSVCVNIRSLLRPAQEQATKH